MRNTIQFPVKIAFFVRLVMYSMCFFCFSGLLWSQQVILSSGGTINGSGGSVSFSLGQVFYTEASGTGGSALQGIQIPFEIYVVTGIDESSLMHLNYLVYPNPVDENLVLRIGHFSFENILVQLYDANGRLIKKLRINGEETILPFGKYSAGSYFLKVLDNGKEVKVFKIIKH
ncbi:MAG: T9SS type A sorting domain-containing protein [Bacteroidales bacterium]|nr:T9SS type A sorting domain-containing protein [Bacteroidales bacterium]